MKELLIKNRKQYAQNGSCLRIFNSCAARGDFKEEEFFLVHKVEYRIGNYIYIFVCMLIYDTDRYKYFMLINED